MFAVSLLVKGQIYGWTPRAAAAVNAASAAFATDAATAAAAAVDAAGRAAVADADWQAAAAHASGRVAVADATARRGTAAEATGEVCWCYFFVTNKRRQKHAPIKTCWGMGWGWGGVLWDCWAE